MSYIGNPIVTTSFVTDTLSGNGGTAFTLSLAPASATSILVAITGVTQDPATYSVSGTTLTFSSAPPSGSGNISVRHLGVLPIVNPINYKFPFFTSNGASAAISLPNNQYLPFYVSSGASSNIALGSA